MGFGSLGRLTLVAIAAGLVSALLIACASEGDSQGACVDDDRVLKLGFYAYFSPVSYSADEAPGSPGFDDHRGYEADLLSALESLQGVGVSLSREGIAVWDDIWLASASSEFDVIGGGITILESRTRDAEGEKAVVFTSGHVTFRQSLLTRAEDASRFAGYDDLASDVRVGVLADTTGEARLLQLTGMADADGVLAAGVSVDTPQGEIVADGSSAYVITAASESEVLAGRRHLRPPSDGAPQVVYLGDELGESELLAALSDGSIDAIARGEIGNRDAAHAHGESFAVALLDDAVERGGFTLAAEDSALASCLSDKLDYLTDGMNIGYAEWLADPAVFMRRAETWKGG